MLLRSRAVDYVWYRLLHLRLRHLGLHPYTVEPRTVGTAYGICTAIQNIGLAYAPWQVSKIINMTTALDSEGKVIGTYYKGADIFFIAVNIVGLASGIVLYIIDIKFNNGILNKVDDGDELGALITSPQPG